MRAIFGIHVNVYPYVSEHRNIGTDLKRIFLSRDHRSKNTTTTHSRPGSDCYGIAYLGTCLHLAARFYTRPDHAIICVHASVASKSPRNSIAQYLVGSWVFAIVSLCRPLVVAYCYCYYLSCHPTTCSMIFNIDHS